MPKTYLSIEPLHPLCQPALVFREFGPTVVLVDPDTTVPELVEWTFDHLTTEETNLYRAAYRQPKIGQPLDDWLFNARMGDVPVPASIWLPPEMAWAQGA